MQKLVLWRKHSLVLFKQSIGPLSGVTTPGQSGPGSDGNKGVFRIPQSSCITGTSPSDCLVSYPGHSFGGFTLLQTKQWVQTLNEADCISHHHYVVPQARIPLTLSRHFSLSFIASGKSSGLHSVSSHSCCMYFRTGRPVFARPFVGVHRRTSLMSSWLDHCIYYHSEPERLWSYSQ